ncbi:MAG: beta-ketoacyl synthase chain length factor [Methylococcaceae bacterium]|nr:beta-ketoacyl synthase chain length factor [Methylococcaceae bacterium]
MKPRFSVKGAAICCPDLGLFPSFGLDAVDVDRTLLPVSLRRRASLTTQLAITAASTACKRAGSEPRELRSVFASIGGEIRVTDELCRALPDQTRSLSPTRFHNSVHNATAGYWGILHQCRSPSVAVAALEDTFAIGLLEACSQLMEQAGEFLLVCYDEFWPQYLAPPMGSIAFSCAVVLSTERNDSGRPMVSLPYVVPEARLLSNELEELIRSAPVSACIPLLAALNQPRVAARVPLSPGPRRWCTDLETL